MSKDELLNLILAYDCYIQEANKNDWYSQNWRPVSMEEFYNSLDTTHSFFNFNNIKLVS